MQKISTLKNLLKVLFVYQGFPPSCQPYFPNKPHAKTILTLQSKWTREKKFFLYNNSAFRGRNSRKFWIVVMKMSSLFIRITNFLRTSTIPIQTSTSYYYLNSWYFQIIECPPSQSNIYLSYLIIILNYLILIAVIIFLVKSLNHYDLLVNQ